MVQEFTRDVVLDQLDKFCPRCQKWKPLSDFRKNKHRPDGFQVYCKTCQVQAAQDRETRRGQKIAAAWGTTYTPPLTQEEVNLAWGLPADAEPGEAGNYIERRSSWDLKKQNRTHQATFRENHPDYHKAWAKRVGYPTTTAGRALWRTIRKMAKEGSTNK